MVPQNSSRTQPAIKEIEINNIDKSFGDLSVLSGLSLDIFKGELCCFLGPSGCGKTTLLKLIDGLLEPDGGNIILSGNDITNVPCQNRDLGMVFQNYALFPHMNVFDNVAYGLRRRSVPKYQIQTRVSKSLSMVKLSGYENRKIHELSGGQQQRVALARALVIEPQALLLDEPLSNLDARLRADMRDEIRRIQTELGITTVYVTHDQEEAMSIADRIVVMNNGTIEQIGTPVEIYENPATAFVAAFVGNINFIQGEISGNQLRILGQVFNMNLEGSPLSGEVICAIRPERISISPEDCTTTIKGLVTRVAYFGSMLRYDIEVNQDGPTKVLMIQVPASSLRINEGTPVTIGINPEDIRIFPETQMMDYPC